MRASPRCADTTRTRQKTWASPCNITPFLVSFRSRDSRAEQDPEGSIGRAHHRYNQECRSIVNSPSMRGRDRKVEGRPSEVALRLEIQKAESGPNPKLHLGKPKGMHVLSDQ